MRVQLVLDVDESDADPTDSTGLTGAAYDRLDAALVDAGFTIADGPDIVDED
jgi:hypothetical protein